MSAGSKVAPGAFHRQEALFEAPPLAEQERMVEALLFAATEPLTLRALSERLPPACDPRAALDLLRRRYDDRGVRLEHSGDGWAFRTAPDLAHLMRREAVQTRKLSRAAIESLAIVAYHQPVTRAEIEEMRGVTVSRGTLDQLIEMGWVGFGPRRDAPGRPATFVTTRGFLDHFALRSPRDLPGLRELREAGLLSGRDAGPVSMPTLDLPPSREDDGSG